MARSVSIFGRVPTVPAEVGNAIVFITPDKRLYITSLYQCAWGFDTVRTFGGGNQRPRVRHSSARTPSPVHGGTHSPDSLALLTRDGGAWPQSFVQRTRVMRFLLWNTPLTDGTYPYNYVDIFYQAGIYSCYTLSIDLTVR